MAGVVSRDDDQARRSLVEPVDDARTRFAAGRRPASAATEQRVHKRAGVVARCGVHDHSRRLVDHQKVFVLEDDLQRDCLGHRDGHVRLRDLELDDVAGRDSVRGIGRLAIDRDQVALDEPGRGRAAQVVRVVRDETVETGRRDVSDQAALGLRIRYPTIRRKTPMLMAESARLKTGQK